MMLATVELGKQALGGYAWAFDADNPWWSRKVGSQFHTTPCRTSFCLCPVAAVCLSYMVLLVAHAQVFRGADFPSDLVFLSAHHEDPELRGMCHVQTAQLDGETNLKLRRAPGEKWKDVAEHGMPIPH